MKYTLSEIFGIQAALNRLTNYQQVVKDQTVVTPFNFTGKTRWNISKNIRICEDAVKPWPKVLEGLKEQFSIKPHTKQDDDSYIEFVNQANKLSSETQEECSFLKIPLLELIDDKNPVSADVLGVLERFGLIQE